MCQLFVCEDTPGICRIVKPQCLPKTFAHGFSFELFGISVGIFGVIRWMGLFSQCGCGSQGWEASRPVSLQKHTFYTAEWVINRNRFWCRKYNIVYAVMYECATQNKWRQPPTQNKQKAKLLLMGLFGVDASCLALTIYFRNEETLCTSMRTHSLCVSPIH